MSTSAPRSFRIAVLPGDGIGTEIIPHGLRVLSAAAEPHGVTLTFEHGLIGGCAIDATGMPLPDETLELCRSSDAVLFGAVGGPKWDDPKARVRPEQGLLGIRRGLGLYANLRPVLPHPALASVSPLKAERLVGVDLLIIRELTGGIYFGARGTEDLPNGGQRAHDTCVYDTAEIERVVRMAAGFARSRRGRLVSADKANVLDTSRLWRRTATRVIEDEFPDVQLEHVLVDACAMQLVKAPARFDVIVTENLFGDILTDEAAVLAGSIGLLPSASLGAVRDSDGLRTGIYEPIHGTAPDIAGRGIANPIGTILSVALLLRHSLGLASAADAVEAAVAQAITAGARTADIGGTLTTAAMTDEVLKFLRMS